MEIQKTSLVSTSDAPYQQQKSELFTVDWKQESASDIDYDWKSFLEEFENQNYQKALKFDTSSISYLKNTKAGKKWFETNLIEKGYEHLRKNIFGYLPKGTKIFHGTLYAIETLEKGCISQCFPLLVCG